MPVIIRNLREFTTPKITSAQFCNIHCTIVYQRTINFGMQTRLIADNRRCGFTYACSLRKKGKTFKIDIEGLLTR